MENIEERIKFRMDDENIPNEIFSLFGELIETVVQLQKKNEELQKKKEELQKENNRQKGIIESLWDYIDELETHNHPNF